MYLLLCKVGQKKQEKKRQREKDVFTPLMAAAAAAGPSQSQELGIPRRSSKGMAETQVPRPP